MKGDNSLDSTNKAKLSPKACHLSKTSEVDTQKPISLIALTNGARNLKSKRDIRQLQFDKE